jgi:septum formation protein
VGLILASASPRRSELLQAAGVSFEIRSADVDESPRSGETPDAYVRRLSEDKARAVAAHAAGRPVLAADTIVLAGGEMLGKPRDAQDATRMLRLLSGTSHEVLTGVCLAVTAVRAPRVFVERDPTRIVALPESPSMPSHARQRRERPDRPAPVHDVHPAVDVRVAVTAVEFSPLTEAEIAWYVGTGEPLDKAGAYAVQGLASRFVRRLDGSYSNVVGLPVALVYEMCTDAGILLS